MGAELRDSNQVARTLGKWHILKTAGELPGVRAAGTCD